MTQADLHAHTTASDGQLTPVALVELAREIGLETIAITDHDTTAGITAAQAAAPPGFRVIPGVELSAEDANGDVHMLGYHLDITHEVFQRRLEEFRIRRYHRAQAMVDKLATLGIQLDWQRVEAQADGGAIGRPHIARAMMEAGYVASVKEAFERYISNDGPGYVSRQRLSPEESIEMIHMAGGVAVLAHPIFVADYAVMIERLRPAGLDGIEVAYPNHSPELEAELREIAQRHGLLITGGSDFHGPNIPGKAMLGSVHAPSGSLEPLEARAAFYQT